MLFTNYFCSTKKIENIMISWNMKEHANFTISFIFIKYEKYFQIDIEYTKWKILSNFMNISNYEVLCKIERIFHFQSIFHIISKWQKDIWIWKIAVFFIFDEKPIIWKIDQNCKIFQIGSILEILQFWMDLIIYQNERYCKFDPTKLQNLSFWSHNYNIEFI